jgi:hypothetical protein
MMSCPHRVGPFRYFGTDVAEGVKVKYFYML